MGPLYGQVILDRYRHPRRFGEMPDAHLAHEDVNPLCGDRLRVALRIASRGAHEIEAVRFQGDACAIAVASADLLAELVEGRPVPEALGVDRQTLIEGLDAVIRPSRLACVMLPLTVLRGALAEVPVR